MGNLHREHQNATHRGDDTDHQKGLDGDLDRALERDLDGVKDLKEHEGQEGAVQDKEDEVYKPLFGVKIVRPGGKYLVENKKRGQHQGKDQEAVKPPFQIIVKPRQLALFPPVFGGHGSDQGVSFEEQLKVKVKRPVYKTHHRPLREDV